VRQHQGFGHAFRCAGEQTKRATPVTPPADGCGTGLRGESAAVATTKFYVRSIANFSPVSSALFHEFGAISGNRVIAAQAGVCDLIRSLQVSHSVHLKPRPRLKSRPRPKSRPRHGANEAHTAAHAIAGFQLADIAFGVLVSNGILPKSDAERLLKQVIAAKRTLDAPGNQAAAELLALVLKTVSEFHPAPRQ
jgi:hypothetical protein